MLIGREKERTIITKLREEGTLGGGYLFFGEPMIGKFAFAFELANSLENNPSVLSDTFIINPDPERNTIGIDEIREIKNFLAVLPIASDYRTVIVRDAENMTREAQNAFLKITEEPPLHSLIILTADSTESILPTLASRLRKIYFPRVGTEEIKKWLIDELQIPETEAETLSKTSLGRPGLAKMVFSEEWKKITAPKDLKFETEAEYDRFILKSILDSYNSKNKNYSNLKDLLHRYHLSKQFNLNKKLQLKSTPWIL